MLLTLAPTLDGPGAEDLRRDVMGAIARGETVTVETSALKVITLTGLQWLVSAHATAKKHQCRLDLRGAGGKVIEEAARTFGFPQALGCGPTCPCRDAPHG